MNINGISTHFTKINLENLLRQFNIIALMETSLTPDTLSHVYNIPGYIFIHHDRVGKKEVGIGFYYWEYYSIKTLYPSPQPCSANPEFIITKIAINSTKLLFCVIYLLRDAFSLDHCFKKLLQCLPKYTHVVITGDHNTDISRTAPSSASLSDLISSKCLLSVSKKRTHHSMKPDRTPYMTWYLHRSWHW